MNNYDLLIEKINKIFKIRNSLLNDYVENILNSPSTINKLIKYYHLTYYEDDPYKVSITFLREISTNDFTIVKTFDFEIKRNPFSIELIEK